MPAAPPMYQQHPYLCIYASQVAACIGANRHHKVSDAVTLMWQRICPASFKLALKRNGLKTDEDAVKDLANANADVQSLVDQSLIMTDTSADVAATYQGVHEQLIGVPLTDRDKALVDAALKKNLFTSYGTRAEPETLDYIRSVMRVPCHTDTTFYKLKMGEVEGIPWFVGGKIDALSDDGMLVIEIKNRVHRLFHRAPAYEAIQVQTYLELLDKPHGILVECFRAETGVAHTSAIPIARDKAYWNATIVPKLRAVVSFVVRLLRDTALQDAFLKSKRPSEMVKL